MAAPNATRDIISRNKLFKARDAVKRFPEHKDVCSRFLRDFEKRGSEAPYDERFGYKKYKAMLRNAVNRHQDTIFIDLNDIDEFCREELAGGDGEGSQPMDKIQVQTSISKMTEDIERNTLRFMRFFYEACDVEKPEQDEGYNMANADLAQETIQKWRQRKVQLQREAGLPAANVPIQMRNPFNVRFKPREDTKPLKFREVGGSHVGCLVTLECLVVRAGEVKPRVEVVTYQCEQCQSEIFQTVEGDTYAPPKECPSQQCRERKQSGKLQFYSRTSKFGKYQELRVQELSTHVPVGGVPRSINVVCSADLCRACAPGDAITLTGVYTPYQLPWYILRQKGTSQEMYVDAHYIKKHKRGYSEKDGDEDRIGRQVEEASKKGNMYELAARSIAPEIFGHENVKKALLLALVGGVTKNMQDGMKIRGEVHTLFMGDPGVAKSQLMKQVCNIAPRSVYTTGKGTSGVGLTATVMRDKMTGEVTLEGGALVLADMGICCIDEFDKMEESDRTAIHEVMEQQSVSIAKAGITTTLNTRTTIIAAANPQYGRYDPYKSPVENIDLPAALLSRFDLLFLLLDTVDPDKDRQLALHVSKVHSNFDPEARAQDGSGARAGAGGSDALNLGFETYDANFMRSYVRRAKSYEPYVDDSLQKDIVDAYVSMRDDEKRAEIDSRKSYTTPRTLLAMLRLSQAHARARFSEKVERQDFEEAMRLMQASKESVELSAPAKKGSNPLDLVHDIIADLSRRTDNADGWVEMAHVVSMAGHKALSSELVHEAIEQWESLSILTLDPEKKMVRFQVPP